jgi:hypothetical protein
LSIAGSNCTPTNSKPACPAGVKGNLIGLSCVPRDLISSPTTPPRCHGPYTAGQGAGRYHAAVWPGGPDTPHQPLERRSASPHRPRGFRTHAVRAWHRRVKHTRAVGLILLVHMYTAQPERRIQIYSRRCMVSALTSCAESVSCAEGALYPCVY